MGEGSFEFVGVYLNQWGILFHALPFFEMNRLGDATDLRLDLDRLVGAHGADKRERLGNRGALRLDSDDLSSHPRRWAPAGPRRFAAAAERRDKREGEEKRAGKVRASERNMATGEGETMRRRIRQRNGLLMPLTNSVMARVCPK